MATNWNEVEGNLVTLAKKGEFDVIAHGCNCFCTMGAGIAPIMARVFGCDTFPMEHDDYTGDINKLGTIDFERRLVGELHPLWVVNAYTQYGFGMNHEDGTKAPIDYEALTLCMRKMNKEFKGLHVGLPLIGCGLPLIGCGLAGGDWTIVKQIMQTELKDCKVTIVHFKSTNAAEIRQVSNGYGEQ